MKSKKGLYVLIALVVIIWGLIIYRVLSNVSFTADVPLSNNVESSVSSLNVKLDSFSIVADYRDPFLGKKRKAEQQLSTKKNVFPRKKIENKVKIIEPKRDIRYKGLIINKSSKSSLAILNIDGKEVLMKKNDTYNDIILKMILQDSVLLQTQKGGFYIRRK